MEKALIKKYKFIFVYSILFVSLFFAIYRVQIKQQVKLPKEQVKLKGTVISFSITKHSLNMILKNKQKYLLTYQLQDKKAMRYWKHKLKYEDEIEVVGALTLPDTNTNFYQFSYRNYLKSIGITYQIIVSKINRVAHTKSFKSHLKNGIKTRIDKIDKEDRYMKLFILGDQSNYDKEIYHKLGVQHLFCISGMHCSIFILVFEFFFYSKKRARICAFPFLVLYAYVIGFTYSFIRVLSCLLFRIVKPEDCLFTTHDFLLLLFSFILLLHPFSIYHSGFLYSFIVSDAIVCCQKRLRKYHYIKRLTYLSSIAFLASLPVTLHTEYCISFSSVIYNLFYVPLITICFFPLTIFTFCIPDLYPLYCFFEFLLERCNSFFLSFPNLSITLGKPALSFLIGYWTLLQLSFRYRFRNFLWCYLFLFLFMILHIQLQNPKFVMFDVGQGDAFLIHGKKTVLIDTGGSIWKKKQSSKREETIISSYLKGIGKRKIDVLILTHGDFDHMGEAISLVNTFQVGKVVFNHDNYNELENELIKVLQKKGIQYYKGLKELKVGKFYFQFLNTKEYEDENENSNVIYFRYHHYQFLLMGDAGVKKEEDILKQYRMKQIDFLKIGHHGSNTSSSKSFIDSINPKYSLISVGEHNRYGHPKKSVIDNLSRTKIYRTDKDGSVMIKLNKNGYQIKTCNP